MLYIASIETVARNFRLRVHPLLAVAIVGMTILTCQRDSALFPLAAAQTTTDSSEASNQVESEFEFSVEGSISIVIFVIAALLLVRWALREKRQPGKRYHRSFAPLCANGSDEGDHYRVDASDHTGDTPESGGAHGGND